ncbi:Undecaprenyl-phosphate alpha-N-acetylglucosaminyl 1-phosphate transferase [anaerobic digester metagenome]
MPHAQEWILLPGFRMIAALAISFFVAYRFIPVIIDVARKKNLVDEPNHRTSHKGKVPTLGGIAIFAGFAIAVLAFNLASDTLLYPVTVAGAMVIFFLGLKDDVLELSPLKKIYGQVIAGLIIVLLGDLRFTNLHGLFGIYQLSYIWSVLATLFIFIVIINSFNLVDGIDGLAAGLAIVASVFFGEWFYQAGQTGMVVMALSLIGVLFAFLRYNLLDSKYKIFMGDTGSMLLGFILAVFTVRFNEMNVPGSPFRNMEAAPAFSFAILMVPLFDTLRLFVVRIYTKCTPFAPDRAHMHHILLKLGFNHLQSTYILMMFNIVFVLLAWRFQSLGTMKLFGLLIFLGTILTIIAFVLVSIQKRHRHLDNKQIVNQGKSRIA